MKQLQHRIIDDFIDRIVDSDISAIILADGYKSKLRNPSHHSMSVGTHD